MEKSYNNSEILLKEYLKTNHCSDVENSKLDCENYLSDIKKFLQGRFLKMIFF